MEIIKERKRVVDTTYYREFKCNTEDGGYTFKCDASGTLINPAPEALANFKSCINGEVNVSDQGIIACKNTYVEPAMGKCSCGNKFALETNAYDAIQCFECGQWYNSNGTELVAPQFWEEPLEPDYDMDDQLIYLER